MTLFSSMIVKMALRNLSRHLRRSLLTMMSIAFGLAVLLWLQCIMEGRNQNITESITSGYIGDVQIMHRGYLQDKLLQDWFAPPKDDYLSLFPPGTRVTRRSFLPSLISSGEQSTPVVLTGMDPVAEPRVTTLAGDVKEGGFLVPDDSPECASHQIVIGGSLAKLLDVGLGSKVVILAQAADGSLGNDLFRVRGIYDSGSPTFDKTNVFSSLNCVAKIGALQGIHEITANIPFGSSFGGPADSDDTKLKETLASSLPPTLTATTWRDVVPSMATMVHYNNAMFSMISFVLFILISIGTVNTLLMSVFERTREFGMSIALGGTPWQIRAMVVVESLLLGVGASVLGTVLGLAVVLYHKKVGFDLHFFLGNAHPVEGFTLSMVVYPVFEFGSFLKCMGFMLIFVILSSVYPAFRASRLSPIEAMRFN